MERTGTRIARRPLDTPVGTRRLRAGCFLLAGALAFGGCYVVPAQTAYVPPAPVYVALLRSTWRRRRYTCGVDRPDSSRSARRSSRCPGQVLRIPPGEVHRVDIGPAGVTYRMW